MSILLRYGILLETESGDEAFSAATDPTPADEAPAVDVNQDLSWIGHGSPDSYDIYFDTESPPVLADEDLIVATWDPGELAPGNIYYWKVVSKKSGESDAVSDVWSFTTAAAMSTRRATAVTVIT
jgi:hypothetical protein